MKTTKFQLNRTGIVYVVTYMVYVEQVKGITSLRTQIFIWLLILISYAQKLPLTTHAYVSSGDRGINFDLSLLAEPITLLYLCCGCLCSASLPRDATVWSAGHDSGITLSYSVTFFYLHPCFTYASSEDSGEST